MCGSGGGCEQRGWLVADSETDGCLKLDRARCAQRSSDKPEVARHVVRCGIQVCRLREDMAVRDVERIGANFEVHRFGESEAFRYVYVFVVEVGHAESGHPRQLAKLQRGIRVWVWIREVVVIEISGRQWIEAWLIDRRIKHRLPIHGSEAEAIVPAAHACGAVE